MTFQPNDVSHCLFDEKKFNTLDTTLSFPNNSQAPTTGLDMISTENSSSKFDELNENTNDSCATPILAPSYQYETQSSFEFDESELMDPSKSPINEVTVTTSVDNNENETSKCNKIKSFLRQTWDQFSLQTIDKSIKQRTMYIETQPPADLRPRYKSDGKRQIEKARTQPMVVKLPGLKHIQLETNQQLLLRLILATYDPNPSTQVYLHTNKLEYHSDDVEELDDGTVCVPLTTDNIKEGKKPLPRLSIVKIKLGQYKSKLTPLCLSKSGSELYKKQNNDEGEKVPVNKAKEIYKQFNLNSSRIICQLLIKENESIHPTDITCETHVIHEKDQKSVTNKRSANAIESDDESTNERPCSSKSKSNKRRKHV